MAATERVIGVRQLRAQLSAYLRQVAGGATVTVGDRWRRPIARLVPAAPIPDTDVLDRLAVRGTLQRGIGKPGRGQSVKPRRGSRLVSDLVVEDRR